MTKQFSMPAILWLALLPEKDFKRAVESVLLEDGHVSILYKNRKDFCDMLYSSFSWVRTDEGHVYWSKIANDIKYK